MKLPNYLCSKVSVCKAALLGCNKLINTTCKLVISCGSIIYCTATHMWILASLCLSGPHLIQVSRIALNPCTTRTSSHMGQTSLRLFSTYIPEQISMNLHSFSIFPGCSPWEVTHSHCPAGHCPGYGLCGVTQVLAPLSHPLQCRCMRWSMLSALQGHPHSQPL